MIEVVVYGNPAPQGSKNYLGRTATGKGIIGEASPKNKPWRADVKAACEHHLAMSGDEPFDVAVWATFVFTFNRPKTVARAKRPFPSVYPDLGKLCRSTEDAISAAGLWRDDCLAVRYRDCRKVYAGEDPDALQRPGCLIRIGPEPIVAIPMTGRTVTLRQITST